VADNDLEPFALGDLQEMATVGSAAGVRIVAQVDRSPQYTSDPVLGTANWTGAKRFLVNSGSLQELATAGAIDSAASANLADFIQWGVKAYPATRYMLVLWDHGGAWRGFGVDETSSSIMKVPAIATGVGDGLVAAGIARFDIIGFDACLMASLEVAEAVKTYGSYLLASEESEPGHGWDYASLQLASATPTTDAPTLARAIADGFQAQANSPQWKTGAGITLSVVDLSRVAAIDTALAGFQTALAADPAAATAIARERAAALEFGTQPDPAASYQMVDMGDLFARLSTSLPGALAAAAGAVRSAVDASVVYQVKGSAKAAAHGLAAYFPPDATLYKAEYDALAGIDTWRNLVKGYQTASGSAATPQFVGGSGTLNAGPSTVDVAGDLAAGSLAAIAATTLYYGIPGPGANDAWLLGDQPGATFAGTPDTAQGQWDYSVFVLDQGGYQEYGYLSIVVTPSACAAYVPFEYADGAALRDSIWELIFDCNSGAVTASTFYVQSAGGAFGPLSPAAGSKLHAVVAYMSDAGAATWAVQWLRSSAGAGFDAANTDALAFGFASLAAGDPYYISLRVSNAAGEGSWIYANGVTRP
jgi:hypothetical protein